MTQTSVQQPTAARYAISEFYLIVLGALLVGYALLGKTVAYIGVPPLYIGEVIFALGIIAFLSSRCVIASLAALPNLLLALLIGWGIIRTLPYLRENGFDALRDSMLVLYGGFAFIVTTLLLFILWAAFLMTCCVVNFGRAARIARKRWNADAPTS